MTLSPSLKKLLLFTSSLTCLGGSYFVYQHYSTDPTLTQPKFTYTHPEHELSHVQLEVTQMIQRVINSKQICTTLQHEAQLAHTLLQSLSHQQHYSTHPFYKLAKSLDYYHQLLTDKKNLTTPPPFPFKLFERDTYPKHDKPSIRQFKYYLETFTSYHYGSLNIQSHQLTSPHAIPLPQHALFFFRNSKHAYSSYVGHNFNPYFFAEYQELAKSMLGIIEQSMSTHMLSPEQHAQCEKEIKSFTQHLFSQMQESIYKITTPTSKRPYKKKYRYLLEQYGD